VQKSRKKFQHMSGKSIRPAAFTSVRMALRTLSLLSGVYGSGMKPLESRSLT
jgi:hypothetical protein